MCSFIFILFSSRKEGAFRITTILITFYPLNHVFRYLCICHEKTEISHECVNHNKETNQIAVSTSRCQHYVPFPLALYNSHATNNLCVSLSQLLTGLWAERKRMMGYFDMTCTHLYHIYIIYYHKTTHILIAITITGKMPRCQFIKKTSACQNIQKLN